MIMFYSSANMDTEVLITLSAFDLSRSPNKHVAFGGVESITVGRPARAAVVGGDVPRTVDPVCPTSVTRWESRNWAAALFHTVMSMRAEFTPEAMKVVVDRRKVYAHRSAW